MRLQARRRQGKVVFVAALTLLAVAVPIASARPVEDFLRPQSETVCAASPDSNLSACKAQALSSRGTGTPAGEVSAASTARDISVDSGFDWGAAAIGAGGAVALLLLGSMAAIAFIGRGRLRVAR